MNRIDFILNESGKKRIEKEIKKSKSKENIEIKVKALEFNKLDKNGDVHIYSNEDLSVLKAALIGVPVKYNGEVVGTVLSVGENDNATIRMHDTITQDMLDSSNKDFSMGSVYEEEDV